LLPAQPQAALLLLLLGQACFVLAVLLHGHSCSKAVCCTIHLWDAAKLHWLRRSLLLLLLRRLLRNGTSLDVWHISLLLLVVAHCLLLLPCVLLGSSLHCSQPVQLQGRYQLLHLQPSLFLLLLLQRNTLRYTLPQLQRWQRCFCCY
jgi:hypothetical protein